MSKYQEGWGENIQTGQKDIPEIFLFVCGE